MALMGFGAEIISFPIERAPAASSGDLLVQLLLFAQLLARPTMLSALALASSTWSGPCCCGGRLRSAADVRINGERLGTIHIG